jgi:hypothetical protein
MAQATPVVSLKQDFDPDEIPLVKLQQTYDDETKEELEVPVIDGRSAEANLYGLNEFNEAAAKLDYDTGNQLFRFFCRILRGSIKDNWDNVVADNGFAGIVGCTPANFAVCIRAWELNFVTKDSRQALIDYLQSARKHRAMTVEVFIQCLKTLARYIEALPHVDPNPPILTKSQIKDIICKAMPTPWQVQFVLKFCGITLVSLLELQNFMANEKSFADSSQTVGISTTVNRSNNNNFQSSRQEERRPRLARNTGEGFGNHDHTQTRPSSNNNLAASSDTNLAASSENNLAANTRNV